MTERKGMVDKSYSAPINRQCRLLELNRSSYYYRPRKISAADLELMRLIDEIHMRYPFLGSRRIRDQVEDQGLVVNRKRIQRLMASDGYSGTLS